MSGSANFKRRLPIAAVYRNHCKAALFQRMKGSGDLISGDKREES